MHLFKSLEKKLRIDDLITKNMKMHKNLRRTDLTNKNVFYRVTRGFYV